MQKNTKGLVVASLFNGLSGAKIALNSLNIKVDKYYSSEVDKYAMQVADANFPEDVQYKLGDVTKITKDMFKEPIDLLVGGSPCQSFSFAGKRKGMSTKEGIDVLSLEQYLKLKEECFEFEGQSYLFWEFVRILKMVKPKCFILENVKMSQKWGDILSAELGMDFVSINSKLVSAANRPRVYWVGVRQEDDTYKKVAIPQPENRGLAVSDIMSEDYTPKATYNTPYTFTGKVVEYKHPKVVYVDGFKPSVRDNVVRDISEILKAKEDGRDLISLKVKSGFSDNKVGLKKAPTIRAQNPFVLGIKDYEDKMIIRRLTPRECARCQTIPDSFDFSCLSNSQIYKTVGNGFTVDVIAHIIKQLNL